jgi:hypothetical protein
MFRLGTDSPLTALPAGDLLDRTVRLYRRDWRELLLIVLWPTLISYAGTIAMTVGFRNFSMTRGDWRIVLNALLLAGGFAVYVCGKAALFFVLGAAAHSLFRRLVDGTPLSAREVYRQALKRCWPLVGATLCLIALLFAVTGLLYTMTTLTVALYILVATLALSALPTWAQVTIHLIAGLSVALALLWLFLLIYERAIYVPQILLVEGRGVFSALGRSFALAGRDVRKVAALLLFDLCIAWAVLSLFAAPLAWYGALHGVNVGDFFGEQQPLWYRIAYETLSQASEILVAPVWLVGCILLYLDRRVRREGLDLEVLANRRLPMPANAATAPLSPRPIAPQPAGTGFDEAGLTVISLR